MKITDHKTSTGRQVLDASVILLFLGAFALAGITVISIMGISNFTASTYSNVSKWGKGWYQEFRGKGENY